MDSQVSDLKYCSSCGKQIKLEAKLCKHCKALQYGPPVDLKPHKAKKSRRRLWIALGVLLIALLAGAGSYYYFTANQNGAPTECKVRCVSGDD